MTKRTLKGLRADFNLTQKEVAEKIGVSPDTISKWENGKTYPDVEDIWKIEELFSVSFADIKFLKNNTV